MPATRAAFGFSPTARNLNPRLERPSSHHVKIVAATTSRMPRFSVKPVPSRFGNCAFGRMSGLFGLFDPGACRNGVVSR